MKDILEEQSLHPGLLLSYSGRYGGLGNWPTCRTYMQQLKCGMLVTFHVYSNAMVPKVWVVAPWGATNYWKLIIIFLFCFSRFLVPIITQKVIFCKVRLFKFDIGDRNECVVFVVAAGSAVCRRSNALKVLFEFTRCSAQRGKRGKTHPRFLSSLNEMQHQFMTDPHLSSYSTPLSFPQKTAYRNWNGIFTQNAVVSGRITRRARPSCEAIRTFWCMHVHWCC